MQDYTVTSETKLIRRKHRIRMDNHATAKSLKEILAKVPDHATFDEIDEYTAGFTAVIFHEEVIDRSE